MNGARGKTMLVLGGGSAQRGLLEELRAAGIRIVLQDKNPLCPGRSLAHEFLAYDTRDAAAACRAARFYKVDGVCTAGTDQPVLAAAKAARARGCPAIHSPETALALTDKEVMKNALKKAGLPLPAGHVLSPADRLPRALSWPQVIKPVDSQGQRGVMRVDSPDAFEAARKESLAWSPRKRVILEEYLPGREVTVSGWVHRGRADIWAVTDRVTREFLPHIGVAFAHRYPSFAATGKQEAVRQITQKSVRALGMEEGPLYFQFLIKDSGEIYVNECAGRLGGACEDISLPPVCGTRILPLLIQASFSGQADSKAEAFRQPPRAAAFAVPLMFCHPGVIHRQWGEREAAALPGVTAVSFLQKPGTRILPPANSLQRAACMVVHGKSPAHVNAILKKAFPRLHIQDRGGRQLLRNILGYAQNPLGG